MTEGAYLDNAATTPLDPRVLEAMLPHLGAARGNPSSLHASGAAARDAVEEARTEVAHLLGASAEEILFTAGGTEADNLAVLGLARDAAPGKRHAVSLTRRARRGTIRGQPSGDGGLRGLLAWGGRNGAR